MPDRPDAPAPARLILGFDFGQRRIGVACADTVSGCATPLATVLVGSAGVDWARIEALLRQMRPAELVVGSPRNVDGSPGTLQAASDRFAADLGARARLPVHRADEFASSMEASGRLQAARASGARRRRVNRGDIDSAAAAIILERWLAAGGASGQPVALSRT